MNSNILQFFGTPWKAFFKSMPVWAIIVANFCRSWTFYMLIISQSRFLEDVLDLDASQAGFIGSIPHLVMAVVVPIGGILADTLRKNKTLTPTNVRKLMNCGGFGAEAFFLLVLSYTKTRIENVGALIIAVGSSGFAISGTLYSQYSLIKILFKIKLFFKTNIEFMKMRNNYHSIKIFSRRKKPPKHSAIFAHFFISSKII
jgi:hypothetical protein